jgi:hypothetical protein
MGDYRITIEAVGGHGCGREAKDGDVVPRCGQLSCPDCSAVNFVQQLRTSGNDVKLAKLEHWPVPGAAGSTRTEKPGPVDDLLTGTRSGSFSEAGRATLGALLALAFVSLVTLVGCGNDTPAAPVDPVAEAAKAAAEERKQACTQASVDANFLQGGFRRTRWSSKDDVVVRADPKNDRGAVLDVSCDPPYGREASWTLLADGLRCRSFGAVRSLQHDLNCEGDGIVVELVTHLSQGKSFKSEAVGLVSSVGVSARSELDRDVDLVLRARRLVAAAAPEDRARVAAALERELEISLR